MTIKFIPRPHRGGVVYTPAKLAEAMVAALPHEKANWLEPSFGDGAFLEALHAAKVPRERIRGTELETARSSNDTLAMTIRGVDFLAWAQTTNERFTNIVGNPPYVPIHKLQQVLQRSAIGSSRGGIEVRMGANYWCAFVAASISLLRPKGNLAFVLPAALEYANYADPIRRQLIQLFESIELHRSCEPLFDDVQDGCVVLIARNCRVGQAKVMRREYANLSTLISGLKRPNPARAALRSLTPSRRSPNKTIKFSDVFELRIGAVTGDASYFLMNEERRLKLGITKRAVVPVVTRSRHLKQSSIDDAAWNTLRAEGERIWLFRPSARVARNPSVAQYLKRSEARGGCKKKRYKIKARTPWYKTPLPERPEGFISGMSTRGPWIALCAKSGLSATNTLYTVRFSGPTTKAKRAALCLALLTTAVRSQIKDAGRRYAEQLWKFEPGDLSNLVLPPLPNPVPKNAETMYASAVSDLLGGNEISARSKADAFFLAVGAPSI